jgi:hypothetical protein
MSDPASLKGVITCVVEYVIGPAGYPSAMAGGMPAVAGVSTRPGDPWLRQPRKFRIPKSR